MFQNTNKTVWVVEPGLSITAEDFLSIYQIDKSWFERKESEYEYHSLNAGQTPELMAYIKYGDPTLDWVILMANQITNVYHEWFMTENQLLNYAFDKYYIQIFNSEGVWDEDLSARGTYEYLYWTGNPKNVYYEPPGCYDKNGNPIKLLPHHYENSEGIWTSYLDTSATPVSIYEYESMENLKRRRIRLPTKEMAYSMKEALSNA